MEIKNYNLQMLGTSLYKLEVVKVNIETKPNILALNKLSKFMLIAAEVDSKINAYKKLVDNNFNLTKNDEAWEFIDEPYEFYQCIPNNTQVFEDRSSQP